MPRRASMLAGALLMAQGSAWGQAVATGTLTSATAAAMTGSGATMATGSAAVAPVIFSGSAAAPIVYASQGAGGMFGITIYFVIIVAMLAGGLYFMRSGFQLMPKAGKGERKLQISEMKSLGNRQFLIVAEYENRKMLLGVCPGRIDYLATLSESGGDDFSAELRKKME